MGQKQGSESHSHDSPMLMKSKKRKDGLSLLDISYDCWTVITSFFRKPSEAFNLLLTSKEFERIFQTKSLNFCSNTIFRCSCLETVVLYFSEKRNLKTRNYVLNLNIDAQIRNGLTRRRTYKCNDRIGLQNQADHNGEFVKSVLQNFPKLRSFTLNLESIPSYSVSTGILLDEREYLRSEMSKDHYKSKIYCSVFHHDITRNLRELYLMNTCIEDPVNLFNSLLKIPRLEYLKLEEFKEILKGQSELNCSSGFGQLRLKFLSLVNILNLSFLASNEHIEVLKLTNYFPHQDSMEDLDLFFPSLKHFKYKISLTGHENPIGYIEDELNILTSILKNSRKDSIEVLKIQITQTTPRYDRNQPKFDERIFSKDLFLPLSKKSKFSSLREISISKSFLFDGYFIRHFHLTLQKLDLRKNESVKKDLLKPYVGNLKELNISQCHQFDDSFLHCLTSLEKLIMEDCDQSSITDLGFSKFRKLVYLSIVGCTQEEITEKSIFILFKNNQNLSHIQLFVKYKLKRELVTSQKTGEIFSFSEMKQIVQRIRLNFVKVKVSKHTYLTIFELPNIEAIDSYTNVTSILGRCLWNIILKNNEDFLKSVRMDKICFCDRCKSRVPALECSQWRPIANCRRFFCFYCGERNSRSLPNNEDKKLEIMPCFSCGEMICLDCKQICSECSDDPSTERWWCTKCIRRCCVCNRGDRNLCNLASRWCNENHKMCSGCEKPICEDCFSETCELGCESCLGMFCKFCEDEGNGFKVCEGCSVVQCVRNKDCLFETLECQVCSEVEERCSECIDEVGVCLVCDETYLFVCNHCKTSRRDENHMEGLKQKKGCCSKCRKNEDSIIFDHQCYKCSDINSEKLKCCNCENFFCVDSCGDGEKLVCEKCNVFDSIVDRDDDPDDFIIDLNDEKNKDDAESGESEDEVLSDIDEIVEETWE